MVYYRNAGGNLPLRFLEKHGQQEKSNKLRNVINSQKRVAKKKKTKKKQNKTKQKKFRTSCLIKATRKSTCPVFINLQTRHPFRSKKWTSISLLLNKTILFCSCSWINNHQKLHILQKLQEFANQKILKASLKSHYWQLPVCITL